jgi:preprotein translocase subunit SecA
MRQVERQVMLRILDQKWREHLLEMDHLKDGIHLRAMGQRDPLVEWQREGFEMFGSMMDSAAQDFVRYVMHLQVKQNDQPVAADDAPEVAAEATKADPDAARNRRGARAPTAAALAEDAPKVVEANATGRVQTVVKADEERTPRNAPCPCGSGKKYKLCHGR